MYQERISFQISPVAELLSALCLLGFKEHVDDATNERNELNPELKEWVESMKQQLPKDMLEEIQVFFNKESFLGFTLFPFGIHHKAFEEVHAFISMLHHLPLKDYYWAFTNTGFSPDIKLEGNEEPKAIIDLLNTTNLPQEEKWKISYLIFDGERTKERVIKLIERFYYQYFQESEEKLIKHQRKFTSQMEQELQGGNVKYLESLIDEQGIDLMNHDVIVFPSYYSDANIAYSSIGRFNLKCFIVGTRHYKTKEMARGEKETLDAIKVLIDERRFKILQMLKKQPYYGYELAQAINVSNSTMSHHLSTLMSHHFIRAIRKENKVYYETNKEEIQAVLQQVERMFID
ncbi:ArsR/SmtB family transcription factor [Bacillus salitolerans]|uniref:ArsR/SmtB family transcription factor n=1 Tax=Bacillus salitolerans TaxID=1437434 RepID=A0ABW4LXJ1_9BACI